MIKVRQYFFVFYFTKQKKASPLEEAG